MRVIPVPLLTALALSPLAAAQVERAVGVGDVDLDGTPDVLLGVPGFHGSNGSKSGRLVCVSGATGAVLWTLDGESEGDHFGEEIDAVGDMDLDGRPDVAAAAPGHFRQPGGTFGRSYGISGATGAVLWTHDGPVSPSAYGSAIAGAGDLDQDGRADVVVGAAGGVFGATSLVAISGTGAVLWAISGPQGGFGHALAAVGDVQADGRLDVAVGATGGAGSTSVVDAQGAVVWTATGTLLGPGYDVDGPGDVDGDGNDDVLAGEPHFDLTGFNNEGRVRVLSPSANAQLAVFGGVNVGGHYGTAVAAPGDVDGDGVGDYAVGELIPSNHPGSGTSGLLHVLSGATLQPIFTRVGTGDDRVGEDVSFAGDLDGDGRQEVWSVASGADVPPLVDVGRASAWNHAGAELLGIDGPIGPVARFGNGCIGRIELEGDVTLGGTFTVLAHDIDPSFPSFGPNLTPMSLVVGVSNTQFAGMSLPIDLGPAGYPGCTLDVSMDGLFPSVFQSASLVPLGLAVPADVTFGIPNNPAYVGVTVHFQWLVDPPGTPSVPVGLTEGLQVTVQP